MFLKIFTTSLCHLADRNAGCIGADDRTRLAVFFDLCKKLLFDVEPFHHHFDHPIAVADFFQIIREIANGDLVCYRVVINRGGVGLDSGL